ncbi:Dabb family protein [Porifericola rhodea]|uniref:Dabb family protein n=1 Tax=Porifericola rhodea TaxID=930972 RepID=UPI002665C543|nr:Dabb family protein [Porifericola rhodea]WKN32266.1 Dabb family protein [Porifericola rhodea]
MIKHVVLFKFLSSSEDEAIEKLIQEFLSLKEKVEELKDIEWGLNISPENHHQGFTHCFVLSFKHMQDLGRYQRHPAHLAFQEVLKPHMEMVFVVDYQAAKSIGMPV